MIQWTEEATRLAWSMATRLHICDFVKAREFAVEFSCERQRDAVAYSEWAAKLLADNLAESAEDRYRREKYGIKEDE